MLRRRGFSTAEILVAIAVIAILTAILVPAVASMVGRARVSSGQGSLEAIADAIVAFQDDVGTQGQNIGYPASLTQLVVPINGGGDICGSGWGGGQGNRWEGPYLHRPIPAGGLPISIGTVAVAFGITFTDPSGIDFLSIDVSDVTDEDASALDLRVDGGDGAAAGTVRWTVVGNGLVTVHWLLPYPDC